MKNFLVKLYEKFKPFTLSYSQEGEDMILKYIFGKKKDGFYVDVGAYHPYRFSNTYHFYKKGWHGINIDANDMTKFKTTRDRDVNLQLAVGNGDTKSYREFQEGAYNTFCGHGISSRFIKTVQHKTYLLSTILKAYKVPQIDFMNIDVEGMDLEVLQSNDWDKYKPTVILIEDSDEFITVYLKSLGYKLVAKTINTLIFKL
jgi:hypothetical protein